ncbi:MAG TPA: YicC/YloC family endoribonuclease, partial [Casimicrobiaceae bacterium]|nr:YicC/YloC family endoribonuclease [Casimicrobiaceae bacterium]
MIASMTGFAAVGAELPGCSLAVELRSVNHRYLDVQVKL